MTVDYSAADPRLATLTAADLYRDVRERLTSLLNDALATAGPAIADQRIPGTPGWSLHDLVAHLAGSAVDIVNGNLDGVTTDPWTSAQVLAREDATLPELLAEWTTAATILEAALAVEPKGILRLMVLDIVVHEHDVRGALGAPGGRDSLALRWLWQSPERLCHSRIETAGLAPLHLVLVSDTGTQRRCTAGSGAGGAVVRAPEFELFRTLTGRRSAEQILGYEWEGDPTGYLMVLSPFGPLPVENVIEAT